jgi:hypothetical protein
METQDQEISLQDIIKVLQKRWKIILLPALAGAVLAAGLSKTIPKQYESYALLRIGYSGSRPLESTASLSEIMNTIPNLQKIAAKVNNTSNGRTLKDIVKYEDKADLLRISAQAETPEKARELVQTATDMVMERERLLYEDAEKQLATLVKYVRETLRPVPLSSGINELMMRPYFVEVAPVLDTEPLKTKTKVIVIGVFIALMFMDILIAFYREGAEK